MRRNGALLAFAVPLLEVRADGSRRFELSPKLHCGVCEEVLLGYPCERYGACDLINASRVAAEGSCDAFCPSSRTLQLPRAAGPEVRVTKGLGTRSYDQVRISVITKTPEPPTAAFFDYSDQFRFKWTDNHLHSALKAAVPGSETTFDIGASVTVRLPKQGVGVAGVLIADPCVGGSPVSCTFEGKFQTQTRIPELINTFVPDRSTDFWGIFGDNFYDRTGRIATQVFGALSLEAKSKLFVSVAGNHDYWVLGDPLISTTLDQCGNGWMQFYGQDTKAAEAVGAGNSSAPFDFSVDPDAGRFGVGCNKPQMSNFFWYNQIGNVALVGQSGAYSLAEAKPFMMEACAWLSQQPGVQVAVLFGHWDTAGLGASSEMSMPEWYTEMAALPGCAELDARHMLKFVMGHTHCNDPHPRGKVGAGFRVAGFGMEGCGNFGMPIVDTTEDRVRFWYFDTSSDALYNATIGCVKENGWRSCTQLATLWLDEPIAPAANEMQIQV